MVFSSLSFLTVFLPIVLLVYMILPRKFCNIWLLLSSLYFYYLGAGRLTILLLLVIVICYGGALVIARVQKKKLAMASAVFLLIALLIYFKYTGFLIRNISAVFNLNIAMREIILPLGLSFFIFQGISYVVDIYRGEKALKNPIDVALYISNFPQLVAGPIVRYGSVKMQLPYENRTRSLNNLAEGLWRFSIGLSKKVILANNLGGCCDIIFESDYVKTYSVSYAWLGAILFSLQIYFDFSGYSDMAIGLGKCFGFDYSENFNYPYMAGSVTEFWRRWHISLSSWFRDYVYIPLGGNRVSDVAWIKNMFVVWLLTGFWHGASWNYVIWGLGYFFILVLEKKILNPEKRSIGIRVFYRIVTIIILISMWVIFRLQNIGDAMNYLGAMFGFYGNSFMDSTFVFQAKNISLILFFAMLFSTDYPAKLYNMLLSRCKARGIIMLLSTILMTAISFGYIVSGGYNPFLYFIF